MKKTYVILILILVVAGGLFFMGKNKSEAPAIDNSTQINGMKGMKGAIIPSDYNIPPADSSAPIKEFIVTGQNFSFTPNTLSVKKGDKVKITFKNSQGTHDFRIDEFKVATQTIKTGEEGSISFIADKTGSFEYYCSVGSHRAMGMKGTLIVQ